MNAKNIVESAAETVALVAANDLVDSVKEAREADRAGRSIHGLRRFAVVETDDDDRLNLPDDDDVSDHVMAYGSQLPDGQLVVSWQRDYFPEDEQTLYPVTSIYHSREDAVQATGGAIVWIDREESTDE